MASKNEGTEETITRTVEALKARNVDVIQDLQMVGQKLHRSNQDPPMPGRFHFRK